MKKYVLIQNGKDEPVGKYKSKAEAADVMEQIIDENNDDLNSDDENYLTAFDFRLVLQAQTSSMKRLYRPWKCYLL